MLVKFFEGTILGAEAIVVMVEALPGLGHRPIGRPEKARNQSRCLFSESLANTAAEQISIFNVGANNIVGELSLYGSLQPIKIASPTASQAQKEGLKDFIQARAGKGSLSYAGVLILNKLSAFNLITLELMEQPVEDSEVTLPGSLYALILNSLSVNDGSLSCGPFNEPGITPDEIQFRQHQETCFNSQIRWYGLQEFCKLEDYALEAFKIAAASLEFARREYNRILEISRCFLGRLC